MFGDEAGLATGLIVTILITGVFGGLISGLLGVGGGIVIVPVFYNLLSAVESNSSIRMKVAVATSLCTVLFTSLVSFRSHSRRGAIDMELLKAWSIPLVFGVICGALFGGSVDGRLLSAIFAVVALIVAVQMSFSFMAANASGRFPSATIRSIYGMLIGFFSALMGIGGGTLSVPLLTAYGYDIRRAVGTASAIGILIAVPGALGYLLTGWERSDLPPFSMGYINWAAALALVPITMAFAPLGAWLAHAISKKSLKTCFGLFLFMTSAKMFYDLLKL